MLYLIKNPDFEKSVCVYVRARVLRASAYMHIYNKHTQKSPYQMAKHF